MKNFKKLMTIATIAFTLQQTTTTYDQSADDAQPTHQGWGRFGTFFENTLTLHPLNGVNALATGDQSDTTFGWHENEEGKIKANRARTEHNNNKFMNNEIDNTANGNIKDNQKRNKSNTKIKQNNNNTQGHWFWKKSTNNDSSSNN